MLKFKEKRMKRLGIWCMLAVLSTATVAWPQTRADAGKAVLALEQQWLKGQKTNNPELVAPLLADKIVITESDGKVLDKAGTLATYQKTKWDSADYADVKVTVFGETAIVTGGFKGKGTDATGTPFDENERWTDTWVKMPGGKWQCVASQVTSIKM
ncbi:MAG TPA: nuclear transport factor 2 family protein [Candidatus Acidoferrales bacterium]